MLRLCELIAVEKNHDKFLKLIVELNELLDRKERRIETAEKQ
ncbi:MAG TPA: hypothetical protein VJP02_32205 [Candidatus Sulfotelmatobacter sp.]|nr:hypothetical protein [Candidatus Sulfotelmatobacter sp.]